MTCNGPGQTTAASRAISKAVYIPEPPTQIHWPDVDVVFSERTFDSPYTTVIKEHLAKLQRYDIHPYDVEHIMRLQYGVLDHLDNATFNREIEIGVASVDEYKRETQ